MTKQELLNEHDIKKPKICSVIKRGNGHVEDIIIQFPKRFNWENVSLVDAGLLNVRPEMQVSKNSTEEIPLVAMELYGELEYVVID